MKLRDKTVRDLARISLMGTALAGVWLLGFPWQVDLVAAPILLLAGWHVRASRLGLLVISTAVSLGLGELAWRLSVRWSGQPQAYYRPEERYARSGAFLPGVDITMRMPHGDLIPMEPPLRTLIAEPREVRFRTDRRGLRNDAEFDDQTLLLIGDSFVLGSGNSQDALLANVLQRTWGIEAYSIGLPLAPSWLLKRTEELLATRAPSDRPSMLLFVFEGNDFTTLPSKTPDNTSVIQPPPYDQLKVRWIRRLGFHTGQRIFNLTRQGFLRDRTPGNSFVETAQLAGKTVGFLKQYCDASRATEVHLDLPAESQPLARALTGVFFIPTKFRVYQPWLSLPPEHRIPLVPPALEALHQTFTPLNVPVVDLTPALQAEAETALANGEFLYWRDDSHWNARGISTAARAIRDFLAQPASAKTTTNQPPAPQPETGPRQKPSPE